MLGGGGGEQACRIRGARNARISSFQHLYDLFVLPRAEITNEEIQGQLRWVILLLIARTSHECYLLSISKTVVVFPPHNLWLYEGQLFSLSFLPETSEQVDCSERWDNDALLEPGASVDWSIFPPCSHFAASQMQLSHLAYSRLFLLPPLSSHFPVYINRVIMWGFIWLINTPSFWAISQRTWIKLPYLCRGAMVARSKFYRMWSENNAQLRFFFFL